jgi:hypothetical protein
MKCKKDITVPCGEQSRLNEADERGIPWRKCVKAVLGMYVPPDPQKMQAAFQAGKVSLNPGEGAVSLVFADYAQPGDKMTLTFDTATKKITGLNINTYMGQEKDVVTLHVQMGSLPDGTNYEQQTVLNATAKQLVVTTTNSNYQKLGAP